MVEQVRQYRNSLLRGLEQVVDCLNSMAVILTCLTGVMLVIAIELAVVVAHYD